MRTTTISALVLALALSSACAKSNNADNASTEKTSVKETTQVASEKQITPEELGELGARIEKQPDQTQQLLSEKGLDEKSFEKEIRKVTENPDASKRYAEAYKKAKA